MMSGSTITEMNKQISLLTSAVNHLKANVKSAADLISLPSTVEGLQESVASIGNTLNSVHLAMEAIQKTVDEHKKTVELLPSDMNRHFSNWTNGSSKIIPAPSATSELDNKTHSENLKQMSDRAAILKGESLDQGDNRTDIIKNPKHKEGR
ncbi:hypothetical protein H1C71_008590 [Ictidomys tridecemlineatus]|nr:hypothetical protein H1C71_008590 [Ictidomys tridecemlineatus]